MESMEVSFMGRRVRKAEHNQELVVEVGARGSKGPGVRAGVRVAAFEDPDPARKPENRKSWLVEVQKS